VKLPNIKFNENPLSHSRVDTCVQTDAQSDFKSRSAEIRANNNNSTSFSNNVPSNTFNIRQLHTMNIKLPTVEEIHRSLGQKIFFMAQQGNEKCLPVCSVSDCMQIH
jgi:hypothetical protein